MQKMERATGVEPASEAWEASILPMNYARVTQPRSYQTPRSASTPGPFAGEAIRRSRRGVRPVPGAKRGAVRRGAARFPATTVEKPIGEPTFGRLEACFCPTQTSARTSPPAASA